MTSLLSELNQWHLAPGDVIYDIETYPNIFCVGVLHHVTRKCWYFEISDTKNDLGHLCRFMWLSAQIGNRWVGFNNVGFDYPVLHYIHQRQFQNVVVDQIYDKAMSIINSHGPDKFKHLVWENKRINEQVDLFKIHHFDNKAKSTSLKMLEFNMRMKSIEDLPFEPGTVLNENQKYELAVYMWHDIKATDLFYLETLDQIRFREQLTEKYGKCFINFSDTKIGSEIFIHELEKSNPGCCYKRGNGKRQIQQTPRDQIIVNDILPSYIQFDHPEFQKIHNWFKKQVITDTKGGIKGVNCVLKGFQFDFGTGGIHGSVESQIVCADKEYIIEDWDVASMYPNIAIANGFYPKHLGKNFCKIYKDLYKQRLQHKKKTQENEMLKLALNGTYGNSNNKYSPFYDPQFTMSITLTGQLSLCMLAEQLMKLSSLQMIQVNTDGVTIKYPRAYQYWVHEICKWWEYATGLTLEDAEYSRMMIRDVNNYIGEYTDGKLKLKGCYDHGLGWHQNHSNLIVPKAAEAALVHGKDITEFITTHGEMFDFFLRTKVPRSSILEWGGEKVDNIVRYYISTSGKELKKVMPPAGPEGWYKRANGLTDAFYNNVLAEIGTDVWDERIHTKNQSKYEYRTIGINTGWAVQLCNTVNDTQIPKDLNYDWYIQETEKIVKPLLGCN